ncbi:MAG: hypothetical protein ACRBF0_19400 [Calditrichia bacterium]
MTSTILHYFSMLVSSGIQVLLNTSDVLSFFYGLAIPAGSSSVGANELLSGFFYLVIAILVYIGIRFWFSSREES